MEKRKDVREKKTRTEREKIRKRADRLRLRLVRWKHCYPEQISDNILENSPVIGLAGYSTHLPKVIHSELGAQKRRRRRRRRRQPLSSWKEPLKKLLSSWAAKEEAGRGWMDGDRLYKLYIFWLSSSYPSLAQQPLKKVFKPKMSKWKYQLYV